MSATATPKRPTTKKPATRKPTRQTPAPPAFNGPPIEAEGIQRMIDKLSPMPTLGMTCEIEDALADARRALAAIHAMVDRIVEGEVEPHDSELWAIHGIACDGLDQCKRAQNWLVHVDKRARDMYVQERAVKPTGNGKVKAVKR